MLSKIFDSSKKIADKSKGMVEIIKIRSTIDKIDTEAMKRKTELGALTFRLFCEGNLKAEDNDIIKLCALIQTLVSEIDVLNNQIASIQVRGICPACNSQNEADTRFCAQCGKEMPAYSSGGGNGKNRCPKCCFDNQPEDTFCGRCGISLPKSV